MEKFQNEILHGSIVSIAILYVYGDGDDTISNE